MSTDVQDQDMRDRIIRLETKLDTVIAPGVIALLAKLSGT